MLWKVVPLFNDGRQFVTDIPIPPDFLRKLAPVPTKEKIMINKSSLLLAAAVVALTAGAASALTPGKGGVGQPVPPIVPLSEQSKPAPSPTSSSLTPGKGGVGQPVPPIVPLSEQSKSAPSPTVQPSSAPSKGVAKTATAQPRPLH